MLGILVIGESPLSSGCRERGDTQAPEKNSESSTGTLLAPVVSKQVVYHMNV